VLISWVLFRAHTLSAAISYLGAMFGRAPYSATAILLGAEIYTPYNLGVLALCAWFSFRRLEVYDWVQPLTWSKCLVLAPLFLLAMAAMFTQGSNPFLYFQF
jgi:hypothetical protein